MFLATRQISLRLSILESKIYFHSPPHRVKRNRPTVWRQSDRPRSPVWERFALGGNARCALCSPVNLALIKYLCFPVDLLTRLPHLVSCLPVSDDIGPTVHQPDCPSLAFCLLRLRLCYATFPLSALLCQPFVLFHVPPDWSRHGGSSG